MINLFRLCCFPLFLAVFLAGCATGPKLTQEQILAQYESIAKLDKGLSDAVAQNVDDLAPDGYSAARASLDKAVAEAMANRSGTANSAATQGLQTLATANQHAEESRDLLREVIASRGKAMQAGASSLFPERTADLDNEFRKVASLVERNRIEDTKERRPRLAAEYGQLELDALKEGTVDAAQAALADAKTKDAPKYAPKTYKLAADEMKLAQSVLEADRTKIDKANTHAARAKYLAEQSMAVTELIKDFDRRDFSREDAVLWYQSQMSEASSPLDEPLPFNEPNRSVVLSLQRSIKELMQQRDDTAAQRSQYEQELSLSAEQRAAIEKVQSLFAPSEAKVYQQRQNVLISAQGFRFPSGGSEIDTENFALMNKIIQSVNIFPDSSVEITGHTDATGSDEANKTLSQRRADNVGKFLVEVGNIATSRIMTRGYGEEQPVASNETTEGRAANRRVDILIINH